jgi:iron complex outermembrane recepter protein
MTQSKVLRTAVRRVLVTGLCASAASLGMVSVNAQESGAELNPIVEEIVVTGSRLRRSRDLVSVSPVQTIDLETIQASGNVTLEGTLNKYPQLKPDNTSTTNQSGGTGVLTANLRGLGAVRTLVLVDGRRFVPADVTGLTDLGTIPDVLIQRVEVVTGGASAVYGSDAIAGAVNFVLRDDFEGVEFRAQYGETERGDGAFKKYDFLLGGNFHDGRGNTTMHASYTERDPVFFGDRAFSRQPLLADATGKLLPFGVGTIPGGLIGVSAADLDKIQGVDLLNTDGACPGPIQGVRFSDGSIPQPFCRPVDQFNYAPPNYLLRPLERWQVTALGHYDITPSITAYGQAFYTKRDNAWQQAPEALNPASPGQEPGTLLIPGADVNPLFSEPLRDFFAANRDFFDPNDTGVFTVRNVSWQIAEFGPRNTRSVSDSFNITSGFRGTVPLVGNDWDWDVFYQFARADVNVTQVGRLSRSRLTLGLDVEVVDGVPRCRSGDLLNCVPVSIFGTDALTDEMVNFLRVSTGQQDQFTRKVAGATIAGDLFSLPAGPVATAFGMEWREEDFSTVPSPTALAGDLGTVGVTPIINSGAFDIVEVFGEARIPIVEDLPGVRSLAAEVAVRFADYSTIGSVTAWKGALDWQIVESVRARASLSRAIRAPNLNELYGAPSSGFTGGVDPCLAVNNPTPAQKDLCVAQGVPPELRDTLQVGASQGFFVTSGGNLGLSEEEADTFTVGAIVIPDRLPRLSVALDYFEITVDDAIAQVGGQALVNSCFQTLDAGGAACQSITRLSSGHISVVEAPLLNVSRRRVSGVDLQANYAFDDLPGFMSLPDRAASLDLSIAATRQFKDETTVLAGQPTVDCAGYYGGPCSSDSVRITPDFSALVRARWTSGPLDIGLEMSHIGRLRLHPNAFPNENGTLGSRNYFDLTAGFQLFATTRLFGGISNLFDKQPPVLGFRAGGDHSTNPQLFDPLGRRYFAGITVGFGN